MTTLDQIRQVGAGELPCDADAGRCRQYERVADQYTAPQVAEIVRAVAAVRARFGANHLVDLLPVRDRRLRDEIMWQAIAEDWGRTRLRAEVIAVRGRRDKVAGRRPSVPDTLPAALADIEGQCVAWLRRADPDAHPVELPGRVRRALESAAQAVRLVRDRAREQLRPVDV
jgi:hypothetical protein